MSFRIQSGQPEVDLSPSSPLSSAAGSASKAGGARASSNPVAAAYSDLSALEGAQDTASISAVPGQLSGDLPIRQDRVDALRAQMEAGTYTVNPHAVANAMLQNLCLPVPDLRSALAVVRPHRLHYRERPRRTHPDHRPRHAPERRRQSLFAHQ